MGVLLASPPPQVSLVTTFRDPDPRYLRECVESVRAQSCLDWELILYDDGSAPPIAELARALSADDARVRLVRAPGRGRRAALTAAHALCRGELVGWVDADDRLLPGALANCIAAFACHPDVGMVYTDHLGLDRHGHLLGLGHRARLDYSPWGMLHSFVTFHFRLYRRAIFEAAGGIDPTLEIGIDYDLCLRLGELAPVLRLAEPLYAYRDHPGQMSRAGRWQQHAASACAVERALRRRGLDGAYALQVDGPRFQIRAKPLSMRGSVFARRNRRSVGLWPGHDAELAAQLHLSGLQHCGVDAFGMGKDLPGLMRRVFRGQVPKTLVIRDLNPIAAEVDAHSRRALVLMFRTTVQAARAQGVRLVFALPPGHELERLGLSKHLRASDVVVVDSNMEGSDGSAQGMSEVHIEAKRPRFGAAKVARATPSHLRLALPVCSQASARQALHICAGVRLCVWLGRVDTSGVSAGALAAAMLGVGLPGMLFSVVGWSESRAPVDRLRGLAVPGAVELDVGRVPARRKGLWLSAADTLVVPPGDTGELAYVACHRGLDVRVHAGHPLASRLALVHADAVYKDPGGLAESLVQPIEPNVMQGVRGLVGGPGDDWISGFLRRPYR